MYYDRKKIKNHYFQLLCNSKIIIMFYEIMKKLQKINCILYQYLEWFKFFFVVCKIIHTMHLVTEH